jgi:hypothetical protein
VAICRCRSDNFLRQQAIKNAVNVFRDTGTVEFMSSKRRTPSPVRRSSLARHRPYRRSQSQVFDGNRHSNNRLAGHRGNGHTKRPRYRRSALNMPLTRVRERATSRQLFDAGPMPSFHNRPWTEEEPEEFSDTYSAKSHNLSRAPSVYEETEETKPFKCEYFGQFCPGGGSCASPFGDDELECGRWSS